MITKIETVDNRIYTYEEGLREMFEIKEGFCVLTYKDGGIISIILKKNIVKKITRRTYGED